MICNVCPHQCDLQENEVGKCLVRSNVDGKLVNLFEGQCSFVGVEPVEKRPLFHFYPGSKYLSVAGVGCSFACSYCLNSNVSQTTEGKKIYFSPKEIVRIAKDKNVHGIAFSFNEPTVHWEYVYEVGKLFGNQKCVVKTNGFARPWVFDKLSEVVGAFNVDLKGNEDDYHKICGGSLKPVLDSIKQLSSKTHLEISYLPVPARIGDWVFHKFVRNKIEEINPNIPVHLLYFYPFLRMSSEQYVPQILLDLVGFFRETLSYVYISNIYQKNMLNFRNTLCPQCSEIMIERSDSVRIHKMECCGEKLKGIF